MAQAKIDRFRQFMDSCLQDDIDSLHGWPLKETATNFGIGLLMLLMAALHLLIAAAQLAFSLIATAGDLLVRGLTRIMPTPKVKESEAKQ